MAVAIVHNEFADDDRATNGKLIARSYEAWMKAQTLCAYLEAQGKIMSPEFEDEDEPLIWHGCTFIINGNVDFNIDEVKALSDMIKCFDGLTMVIDDGNISCAGTKRIYEDPREDL